MSGTPKPCGTLAAYKRHQRKGEAVCDLCRKAWADWHRQYRQQRDTQPAK